MLIAGGADNVGLRMPGMPGRAVNGRVLSRFGVRLARGRTVAARFVPVPGEQGGMADSAIVTPMTGGTHGVRPRGGALRRHAGRR